MQDTNILRESLIQTFAESYMEKLFYFCLKKTGNQTEAEDLTQDIALQIITALNKGVVPTSFSAWVWKIARNRYYVWAKEKHHRNQSVAGADVSDYEIPDERKNILGEMIQTEQMALLRRELAFIRSDYRNIVVAYYIENKCVREIASALALSENAVQQRLHRARTLLKEGMDMAREFGKLSYKPEEVNFIANGMFGTDNEPLNSISRSLCKNILLAAYRTPSTAEELAMEVGVALPYMEEELASLVATTLMKKNGDKYETNFFIVSAEAQEKISAHLQALSGELTKAMIEIVDYQTAWWNENAPHWHEGYQTDPDMRWALLMTETDNVSFATLKPFNKNASEVSGIGPWGHTLRPHDGEWDIIGLENHPGDKLTFVSLVGCVGSPEEKDLPEIKFRQYVFENLNRNMHDRLLSYAHGKALISVADGRSEDVDKAVLNRLESYGYIKKTDGGYIPTFLVMRKENAGMMSKKAKEQFDMLRKKATEIATRQYLYCREQIYKEIPEFLQDNEFQIDHACANIFSLRGAVVEEAMKQGYLSYGENSDKRILGSYLVI